MMSISSGANAPYLHISTETVPEAIVLRVVGEVDLANVNDVIERHRERVSDEPARHR
jgi:hypothetical protein